MLSESASMQPNRHVRVPVCLRACACLCAWCVCVCVQYAYLDKVFFFHLRKERLKQVVCEPTPRGTGQHIHGVVLCGVLYYQLHDRYGSHNACS